MPRAVRAKSWHPNEAASQNSRNAITARSECFNETRRCLLASALVKCSEQTPKAAACMGHAPGPSRPVMPSTPGDRIVVHGSTGSRTSDPPSPLVTRITLGIGLFLAMQPLLHDFCGSLSVPLR